MSMPRLAISTVFVLVCGCAGPRLWAPPTVVESLRVPDRLALSHEVPATGVQIYDCAASKADAARYEWLFRAPEAELYDSAGRHVGKHYAGPTWEANDGSKIVAEVKGRDDGPDANAIPWLLLATKTSSGNGAFSRVQAIQRLNTVGGKAPSAGCSAGETGREVRVPYKAIYYFYAPAQ
jgi:hypothetical protein